MSSSLLARAELSPSWAYLGPAYPSQTELLKPSVVSVSALVIRPLSLFWALCKALYPARTKLFFRLDLGSAEPTIAFRPTSPDPGSIHLYTSSHRWCKNRFLGRSAIKASRQIELQKLLDYKSSGLTDNEPFSTSLRWCKSIRGSILN